MIPIRIKITRGLNGHNAYPPFNQLPGPVRGMQDWSTFFDQSGIGMHYSSSGFGEGEDPTTQYCGTLVPVEFAEAAADAFPALVEILTEAEWQSFWEGDCYTNQPDQEYAVEILQALAAKQALGIPLTSEDQRRLDPADSMPGITTNTRKFWATEKARRRIAVNAGEVARLKAKRKP